jgi:hypothetical protein
MAKLKWSHEKQVMIEFENIEKGSSFPRHEKKKWEGHKKDEGEEEEARVHIV